MNSPYFANADRWTAIAVATLNIAFRASAHLFFFQEFLVRQQSLIRKVFCFGAFRFVTVFAWTQILKSKRRPCQRTLNSILLSIINLEVRIRSLRVKYFEKYNTSTAANNALAKYGAGRCNFSISNIAGLVRGWTVFV